MLKLGRDGHEEVAAAPEPAAAAAVDTEVFVSGAANVVLIRGSDRFDVPGTVPPGTYKVQATVGDQVMDVGTLEARAGVPMKILCSEALHGCRIRER